MDEAKDNNSEVKRQRLPVSGINCPLNGGRDLSQCDGISSMTKILQRLETIFHSNKPTPPTTNAM